MGGGWNVISQVIRAIGARLFDILVGFAFLYVANLLLDPAPIGAALAWSLGTVFFWLRGSRAMWHAAAGILAGALLGAAWHVFVHLAGRSPVPAEGQVMHVLMDATVGLLVGGLAVAASLGRHLSRQRRAA